MLVVVHAQARVEGMLVVVLFAACAWTTAHGQAVYPEKMTYVNPTPTAAEIFVNRYTQ
jgi:hypothetical protein